MVLLTTNLQHKGINGGAKLTLSLELAVILSKGNFVFHISELSIQSPQ